ncbi:MAG: hypothetical protein SGILL_002537, partial [Bacillariaceae sp.]
RQVEKLAMEMQILKELEPLMKKEKKHLLQIVHAAVAAKQPLKLVLAIDEASSCPRVIRGILRNPDHVKCVVMKKAIDCALFDDSGHPSVCHELKLNVDISICGTGVASSTIGSLPDNFAILTPYHEKNYGSVIAESLKRNSIESAVPWSAETKQFNDMKIFEEHLPVLAQLMKNGRIASITLRILREHAREKSTQDIQEGVLVDDIIKIFMMSNGLSSLRSHKEHKRLVAASAMAVHLFSKRKDFEITVPNESENVANWAAEMNFFPFSIRDISVRELVETFGLLEPSAHIGKYIRGESIAPPLKMSIPQQLIAAFMLGLDLTSMLEPTWFGFELMSTHFVKCALAASAAVEVNRRPSVQCALQTLGFQLHSNTKGKVNDMWGSLEHCYATFFTSRSESGYHSNTQQLNVGLDILESTDGSNESFLQIDDRLRSAVLNSMGCRNANQGTIPPIACVNEGNSDLCDGIVTFFAIDRNDSEVVKRMSILLQAKDYHGTSKVDATKMNLHAQKHDSTVLDACFGETRLFCVASTRRALFPKGSVGIPREYVLFAFDDGLLLTELLESLQSMRSREFRIAKYACVCNKYGDVVPSDRARKRKATSQDAA